MGKTKAWNSQPLALMVIKGWPSLGSSYCIVPLLPGWGALAYEVVSVETTSSGLRQKLVHPKTPHHKQSNVIYAIQCSQEDCSESYIGETKQLLHKRMSQHRSGKDSAVHIHLKETGHTFTNSDVRILAREPRWSERGVKEAIFVKKHKPSLNRDGGLRHNLSPIYNPILLKD